MPTNILLLNVGHPRTGTGYMTKLFQSLGFVVGHEVLGKDGTSDWAFSFDRLHTYDRPHSFYETVVPRYITYNVRDPLTAIPSIMCESLSLGHRKKVIDFNRYTSAVDRAAHSLLSFDKQIRENRKPHAVIRIEHAEQDAPDQLQFLCEERNIFEDWVCPKERYNARPHRDCTAQEWHSLHNDLMEGLEEYCKRYGYPSLADRLPA